MNSKQQVQEGSATGIRRILERGGRIRVEAAVVTGVVAEYYGVSGEELSGPGRTQEVCFARHAVMYVLRTVSGANLPAIGRAVGRDHTTVLHGISRMEQMVGESPAVRREIELLSTTCRRRIEAAASAEVLRCRSAWQPPARSRR
jgi:chromosomal replication initiator protein